ncbi:MAG: DUF3526 domain-containing protein [Gammaproteobacteria bacterium]|nr:DUF3526 domain-containing protein [Gammaproteobacteria bacterium]
MTRYTIFSAAVRCEWRNLRRDPALWLVLAIILSTVGYALHNGRSVVQHQNAAIAATKAEEQERLANLRLNLADIDAGRIAPPERPFRDPRLPIFVGGGSGATGASLPPHPLALIATGQSDLYPASIKITSGGKDSFLFSDEIANPTQLLTGSFDLAFVLVFIYPLWMLALIYNLISAEREQGTLALTGSCPVSLRTVFAGKLLVRAGVLILVTVVAVYAGLAMTGAGFAGNGNAYAALGLVIIVYGFFWVALATAVNTLGRDSAYNAMTLVIVWIMLLLILPALINAWSQSRYPSPSRAEMVLSVRAASNDANLEQDAALALYEQEHGHSHERGSLRERTLRRISVTQAAAARADSILAAHDAQIAKQHDFARRFAYASPALLMYDAMAEIAGTGRSRYAEFFSQIDQFHQEWREFFVSRAKTERMLTDEDYRQFPHFQFEERLNGQTFSLIGPTLTGIAVLFLLFAGIASRGLRRCSVVGRG